MLFHTAHVHACRSMCVAVVVRVCMYVCMYVCVRRCVRACVRASRACVLSVVINLFLAVTANCLNNFFLCTSLTLNYHMFNFNELIYFRCYVAGMFQANFCYRTIRCYLT